MPIQWAQLKVTNGPSFAHQVDEVIMTYVQEQLAGNDRVVKYLYKAVVDQVDEVEGFISTIDEDARCVIFQKQSRRLRKLLQVRPEEYVKMLRRDGTLDIVANASADVTTDPMYDIRGSITEAELGVSVGARQKGGELAHYDTSSVDVDGSHQFNLPLPPGVDYEITADDRSPPVNNVRGSNRRGGSSTKMKRKVYPWESGVDTGEDFVGPATERIPPGGTFAVQFVLNKEEFQHYKARLQIVNIQKKFQEKQKAVSSKEKMTIHQDFVNGKKKSAIDAYSALRTGPYVEPSYNSKRIYRNFDKDLHLQDRPFTTSI